MADIPGDIDPYFSANTLGTTVDFSYLPEDDRLRAEAYKKYDQFYWNDREQFQLRVLEGEDPVYVPNARTVVDTASHFFLKGLRIAPKEAGTASAMGDALKAFLDREMFYARFQTAKHAGVARGDWAFHLTADPSKPEGSRLSLTPVQPWKVILDTDPDDVSKVIRAHLVELVPHPEDPDKQAVKELLYDYGEEEEGIGSSLTSDDSVASNSEVRTVYRTETIWSLDTDWYDEEDREQIQVVLPREALPAPISTIPVYWFNNIGWDDEPYGFSELKGFEKTLQGISQVVTDQSISLALEGLGVYATDGGRPVNNDGVEVDWEISPGKVMEVPSGAYFRRVEGVGSVKPNMDHIEYLESKIREAGGLSDVALGRVDVQTAQSGIALAIKFMPTLAKLEERDEAGMGRLRQLFHDWKLWYQAYEGTTFTDEINVSIGDKLPTNRTERINELNNMLDRGVISKQYYRDEMQQLGYIFPDNIVDQIADEKQAEAEQSALLAPPGLQENAEEAVMGERPTPENPNQPGQRTRRRVRQNRSNNAARPNESSGTEATQSVVQQARGGRPPVTVGARDA